MRLSLEDRLSNSEQAELATHLESCEWVSSGWATLVCRQELERLAAASQLWGEARLLGGEAEPGASTTIGLAHGTLEANVVTRQVVHTLPPQQEPVNAVAFSPDGKLLAIGTGDWRTENFGEVELWDPASGKHISNAWHSPRDVKALAFSPDGKRLAIAHTPARTAGGAGAVAIVGVLTSAPYAKLNNDQKGG